MPRITINKTIAEFSTKETILPEWWDVELGRANSTGKRGKRLNPDVMTVNTIIDKLSLRIKHYYNYFLEEEGYVTADMVRKATLGLDETQRTILDFFKKHNEHYRRKIGTSTTELTYSRYMVTMFPSFTFLALMCNAQQFNKLQKY